MGDKTGEKKSFLFGTEINLLFLLFSFVSLSIHSFSLEFDLMSICRACWLEWLWYKNSCQFDSLGFLIFVTNLSSGAQEITAKGSISLKQLLTLLSSGTKVHQNLLLFIRMSTPKNVLKSYQIKSFGIIQGYRPCDGCLDRHDYFHAMTNYQEASFHALRSTTGDCKHIPE